MYYSAGNLLTLVSLTRACDILCICIANAMSRVHTVAKTLIIQCGYDQYTSAVIQETTV